MNVARVPRRVWFVSVLLLLAAPGLSSGGLAQKAETAPSKKTSTPVLTKPAGITGALAGVYQATRTASLRIEDCAPVTEDPDCKDPNGVGSGVLISADGNVLTAYHVVFNSSRLEAVTLDKKRYPLTVVGFDETQDLALLKINIAGAPFVPLTPGVPRVGQTALAIGNSGGKFLQPKVGKLLALDAAAGRADFPAGTLQLDAPLAPGDSGGPILNDAGQLIGITSYIRLKPTAKTGALPATASYAAYTATLETTSYAVPVTAGSALLARLQGGLKREAPIVGISTSSELTDGLTVKFFSSLGLGSRVGFVFNSVVKGGPADLAGLRPLKVTAKDSKDVPTRATGDVITAIDGQTVTNYDEFLAAVRSHEVGDKVTLTVYRDGAAKPLSISLTLAPRTISLGQSKP